MQLLTLAAQILQDTSVSSSPLPSEVGFPAQQAEVRKTHCTSLPQQIPILPDVSFAHVSINMGGGQDEIFQVMKLVVHITSTRYPHLRNEQCCQKGTSFLVQDNMSA
jgi:hypothetical protein